jgi:hypothetical protein
VSDRGFGAGRLATADDEDRTGARDHRNPADHGDGGQRRGGAGLGEVAGHRQLLEPALRLGVGRRLVLVVTRLLTGFGLARNGLTRVTRVGARRQYDEVELRVSLGDAVLALDVVDEGTGTEAPGVTGRSALVDVETQVDLDEVLGLQQLDAAEVVTGPLVVADGLPLAARGAELQVDATGAVRRGDPRAEVEVVRPPHSRDACHR